MSSTTPEKMSTINESGPSTPDSLGELDIPTDEVAAAAEQIKQDVTQQLHDTEQQIQESVTELKQNASHFFANYKTEIGPLFRKQKATSIQWWAEFNHQPMFSKLLLGALLLTNVVLPLAFLNHRESWVVLGTYACVSLLSHFTYQLTPARSKNRFTYSLLSHLLFVPLLFWLSARVQTEVVAKSTSMEHVNVFLTLFLSRGKWISAWMRSVLTVNCIVLLCDVITMTRSLTRNFTTQNNMRAPAAQGHAHMQTKPHFSEQGKHALISNSEDDALNRARHQEGIKQRMRAQVPAPSA